LGNRLVFAVPWLLLGGALLIFGFQDAPWVLASGSQRRASTRLAKPNCGSAPCDDGEVLNYMKRMLNLGPDTGFGMFDPFTQRSPWQQLALARAHGHMPSHREFQIFCPLLNPLVAGIAKGIGFAPIQERDAPGHGNSH
jgi:hypothetical protein